jgi:hypothetical protein
VVETGEGWLGMIKLLWSGGLGAMRATPSVFRINGTL